MRGTRKDVAEGGVHLRGEAAGGGGVLEVRLGRLVQLEHARVQEDVAGSLGGVGEVREEGDKVVACLQLPYSAAQGLAPVVVRAGAVPGARRRCSRM
jgi:hypothetical protein